MSINVSAEVVTLPALRALAEQTRALDRVIHDPVRLFILALLVTNEEGVSFKWLLAETTLAPGNLGAHLGKLEGAGYIAVMKTFYRRRPYTSYRLSPAGQAAWDAYWGHLQAIREAFEEIAGLEQAHWPGDRWAGREPPDAGGPAEQ